MKIDFRLAAAGAAFAAFLAVAPQLRAQSSSINVLDVCTSDDEMCTPVYSTNINLSAAGNVILNFTFDPTSCSNISVVIKVDGATVQSTGFLTPGQSTGNFSAGVLSAGSHTITIQGTGEVGGCNEGLLESWGGTLTEILPGVPATPAPSTLFLLLAGLAALVPFAVRRQRGLLPR